MTTNSAHDHIFISYATEDAALADWLARKLASEGYAIWYDRLKLLGGEPWPQDIDVAIKHRTYRMLGLLSRFSTQKENPTRERTTAQAIAKERKIPDFLIPLNVDGLRATELPWNVSDTNYIPFHEGWARGLTAVLKKLSAVGTPRILGSGAALAVASAEDYGDVVLDAPEPLITNILRVASVPATILRFTTTKPVPARESGALRRRWPCHRVTDNEFLAFDRPPSDVVNELGCAAAGGGLWASLPDLSGIRTRNLVVSLIHASLEWQMGSRGLTYSVEHRRWFVPPGRTKNNWLQFHRPDGSMSQLLAVGERTFRKQPYRYHLSPTLRVLRGSGDPFLVVLRVSVHLTEVDGRDLPGPQVPSRRKSLCRNWWNKAWLARTLALSQMLADPDGMIRIGTLPTTQLVLEATPLIYEAARSINEERSEPTETEHLQDENGDEEADES